MRQSKKELNELKSSILKRDLFIYQDIENRMRKFEGKRLKIAYFNQLLLKRRVIELRVNYAKKHKDNLKVIQSNIDKKETFGYAAKYAIQNSAAIFWQKLYNFLKNVKDASNALNDNERLYLYVMIDQTTEEISNNPYKKYLKQYHTSSCEFFLTRNIAFPYIPYFKRELEEKNKDLSCLDKEKISEFFITLSCPINKADCESLQEEIANNHFINLLEPELWQLSSNKTAYVKIDFSQPIDVIIEVIKNIKTIVEQDKHNTLTPTLYEAYSGEQVKTFSTSVDDILKKRERHFSLEEKLTDMLYIYDCKKINMPDSKIRDNLFAYYQDKKDTDNLDDTLRIAIGNYKKVLKQLNTDFSPFD